MDSNIANERSWETDISLGLLTVPKKDFTIYSTRFEAANGKHCIMHVLCMLSKKRKHHC